ncbi:TIGR01666 family membrane protein [Pasteurellaceae bacterium TAE3-ERU1]|nr:TIGR01666 family membrane protein [Pasteurellaceae bacterium TAE3-ERU1]
MRKLGWLNNKIISVIPVFIALNLASIFIYWFDISTGAMPFVLGIIAAALVDLDHNLTGKLQNIIITLIAFTLCTFGAQYALSDPLLYSMMITPFTFMLVMMGAFGQRYSTIAFGTLAVALYTALTYLPETPWYLNPFMIITGTLLYSLVTIVVYLFFPRYKVDESLADAFLALADYLDGKANFFDPDNPEDIETLQLELARLNGKVIVAFSVCQQSLFVRLGRQHTQSKTAKLIRYYYAAQDILERASSSHFDYAKLVSDLQNNALLFRIQRMIELQADACRNIAHAILRQTQYTPKVRLARAAAGLKQSFALFEQQNPHNAQRNNLATVMDNLSSIQWQILFLGKNDDQIQDSYSHVINVDKIRSLREMWVALKNNLTFESQLFRHAVRLSIVVLACSLIVVNIDLERGYWILLTAVFVCQPNYSATKKRLRERIIGTLAGVLIGSLIPFFTATLAAKLGLLVASSTLFFFFKNNNYSFSTCFITIQVLISFDISGFDIYAAMWPRMIDTVVGAIIAGVAVSYLWPDWKYMKIGRLIGLSIKNNARYLLYVMTQLLFGEQNHVNYRSVRLAANKSAAELSTVIADMNSEPQKYKLYLQNGFQILKENYGMLGYISSLGALRFTMSQRGDDKYFLLDLYPASRQLIDLLEQIQTLDESELQAKVEGIQARLAHTLESEETHKAVQQDKVISQQLLMISNLIVPLKRSIACQAKLESAV